ncbi:MAG TPA: carbamoyltransferase HypF, partial [Roseiflexaceae bacterium]|nr:carbamoyltransferase HypF [Roseiflexaceae bacterium]
VGFRPFVYRLATSMGLAGWVNNTSQGVFIEAEGSHEQLRGFLLRIETERPPRSFVQSLESALLEPVGYTTFEVRHSDECGAKTAFVLPDIAICSDCLAEIFDPTNRRYRYPFTNCTNCGPRFSIIEALPYDRANTTMRHFAMCKACQAEYDNPLDRRFHAQPNACPRCGPQLAFWGTGGNSLADRGVALVRAAEAIRQGAIVAVKGLGGFHLMVDAHDQDAVQRLRLRKSREEKPFALMYPALDQVLVDCQVSELEERLLRSPESPIVLLRRRLPGKDQISIAPAVAPHNPYLGVMLPYTPLHHLLLAELGFPVVATSGNRSDEPICTDEREALDRLGRIADYFLIHNRPIARHVDDSIVRVMLGSECVLRRARGYAPLPIHAKQPLPATLAVGAHLKNTVAITVGAEVFGSQHIGDLETPQAFDAFNQVVVSLAQLYEFRPAVVACDAHPDYRSTQFAEAVVRKRALPLVRVQHHYAHVLSCMAENELAPPILGVAWDGTGYGSDGTIWGGEWLCVNDTSFERTAHLRTFRLPGGETAIREPRRSALGLLYELCGDALFARDDLLPVQAFSAQERAIVRTMLQRGINAPVTSSAGRLFDAIAALVGVRQESHFEAQAALELECALAWIETDQAYPVRVCAHPAALVVDWEPMVYGILDDLRRGLGAGLIAAKFHNTLAEMIVAVAEQADEQRVVLSGGCFQNRYLTERAVAQLRAAGFRPFWHQRIPANDGGIALGQALAAARVFNHEDHEGHEDHEER